ncbi:unnamed protein product [Enterobius vermicularis]|uniref:Copper transport protein n=1 Tax=Enterobius vermicularis TaxID=51028 RepID=A0A0N4UVR8_ENTVE|nr:unnamed protein product [Enterobius vermicularis]
MKSMMKMYFHFRTEEYLLFKTWLPETTTGYYFVGSCIAILCISFIIETIQHSRSIMRFRRLTRVILLFFPLSFFFRYNCGYKAHRVQTLLYFFQTFGSYSLMLLIMTYNIPVIICVIVGRTVAFFLLAPLTVMFDSAYTESCCG